VPGGDRRRTRGSWFLIVVVCPYDVGVIELDVGAGARGDLVGLAREGEIFCSRLHTRFAWGRTAFCEKYNLPKRTARHHGA
jgi:hypothetical protein